MINENERGAMGWLNTWFLPLLIGGIVINALGLFVTILEPDGALYASIAKAMAQSNDFINLKVQGKDWLDKPHFPFWITAISYKLFGITTFAYKFPALLFWGLGLWYTYQLSLHLYNRDIARLSALIYATAAHLVISNNDVRAEPYLTGLIIGSIYHFCRLGSTNHLRHLIAGSLLAGCAVMTKGPFVLITICSGFVLEWVIKNKWNEFSKARWWVAILLIIVFILPELICLYLQFDMHPEKLVFGKQGVSGIRFFFWDSQFGRFFNTGPIKGQGDYLFYFHTLLWAFLPWSLILVAAIAWRFKNFKKNQLHPEYICIGALTVTFIIFSLSRFQLPHYLNILFPFLSIITAHYLYALQFSKKITIFNWVQCILAAFLVVACILLACFFNLPMPFRIIIWALVIIAAFYVYFGKDKLRPIIGYSYLSGIFVYGFLNLFFYPALLKYQSGSEAAFYVNKIIADEKLAIYKEESYSFDFYSKPPVNHWGLDDMKRNESDVLVFTSLFYMKDLMNQGFHVRVIKIFPHFHISQLTPDFISYKTRQKVLQEFVLVKLAPQTK